MASRRSRSWSPFQLKRLSREMKESLEAIVPLYREAHEYTYERRDSGTDENKGHRISSSGKSDPTGEAVISQEDNRRRLNAAARKLEHAAREIDAAHAQIKRVFTNPEDEYHRLEA